ncbi:hypothetical protein [Actinorugispora endophytica]|uniref:hypothetical protein n=1 Tax=Actinorugispora endophytica TaxID=1605990 RepID=UPI001AADB750|nr:hypothetical protein [Actinorugispora endophytica]
MHDRNSRVSPLRAAEAEFLRVGERLELTAEEAGLVWPVARMPLVRVRAWLLRGEAATRDGDAVWRRVLARARADEAWMVGAVGLAMPGLRSAARRVAFGLAPDAADEVEAEILAGFLDAVAKTNPDWSRLAWRLRCRAQRAGLRARYAQARQPVVSGPVPDSAAPRRPWGHPDLVLADAVRHGVVTAAEAQLIAETRLENTPLTRVAAELGADYRTLQKRRGRAEKRLVDAIRAGEVSSAPAGAPTAAGDRRVLAAMVERNVLSADEARLIERTRLEGVPLTRIAAEAGAAYPTLAHQRRRAEARLRSALASGAVPARASARLTRLEVTRRRAA